MDLAPFELSLETRGYEIDTTGTVPMAMVFRYFEHKRWTMMRDPRLGLVDAVHEGHFFVVRDQTFEILRRVGQGVPLLLRTWFVTAGRSSGSVHHEAIRVRDGAMVAHARVTGVWIGPHRKMARLPDAFRAFARAQARELHSGEPATQDPPSPAGAAATGGRPGSFFDPPEVTHPRLGLEIAPPASPPPASAFAHPVRVPHRELDVFSHVNAATWLRYAEDARVAAARIGALPEALGAAGYNVRTAITYHREAVVDTTLNLRVWPLEDEDHAVGVAILDPSGGAPYCRLRIDVAPGARPISPAHPG